MDQSTRKPEAQARDPHVLTPVADALFRGNKIEAIKRYRESHGGGLKGAKDAVEELEANLRAQSPDRFQPRPRAGCFGVVVLLFLFGWTFTTALRSEEPESEESEPPEKVVKSLAEWKKQLTSKQFQVTRMKATEPAYSGKYWNSKKDGLYECVCCGQQLFDSKTKFESGTGWPSFWEPIKKEAVEFEQDTSGGEIRTEVLCSRCDAHLGHVFDDGPAPTGMRYCMNSAALKRVARPKGAKPAKPKGAKSPAAKSPAE